MFDFTPAWRVLLAGALVALLPALWVVRRNRSAARVLQALAVLTLFLTLDLVVLGAFTRLTDSGLGCPDWPGCYGHGSPLGASAHIDQAQQTMPTGPVTTSKAWIEMLHRYLATAVGALILCLTLWHYRWRRAWGVQGAGWGWSAAALVWVCVQGAFGALTVTMKLFPAIVTLHLLGALVLLALLAVVAARLQWVGAAMGRDQVPWLWRRGVAMALFLLLAQAGLGAWVSSNYAVLACSDFPACHQGQWWPAMDFVRGFEWWRPLGYSADGSLLVFEALRAIHVAHRGFAVVVVVALLGLLWTWPPGSGLRWLRQVLAALLLLQVFTGIGNVVLQWPMLGALLHTGGAAGMVLVLVWILGSTQAGAASARGWSR